MNTVKIFLASSAELKDDRIQFELFINRKNKEWAAFNVFFDLQVWEDFMDAMSATRLQDEYNKEIARCDIFVLLYWTKMGKYTAEEFEVAYQHFKTTKKPLIYTYHKQDGSGNETATLQPFRDRLAQLGHFEVSYKNTEDLLGRFGDQLSKLRQTFLKDAPPPGNSMNQQAEKIYNIGHIDNANFD